MMKLLFCTTAFFCLNMLIIQNAQGQATGVPVRDTRNADSLPSYYNKIVAFEFKANAAMKPPRSTSGFSGLMTFAPWSDATGGLKYQLLFHPASLFLRTSAGTEWNNWLRVIIENSAGVTNMGNGSAGAGLNVNGKIRTKEVKVETANWPDYVFKPNYKLMPLEKLEQFIKQNGHLPEVPSAKEVEKNGVEVGANQALLLKKIEELTLYVIELKNENRAMKKRLQQIEKSH